MRRVTLTIPESPRPDAHVGTKSKYRKNPYGAALYTITSLIIGHLARLWSPCFLTPFSVVRLYGQAIRPCLLRQRTFANESFPRCGRAHWSSRSTDRKISVIAHRSSGILRVCVGIVQRLRRDARRQHHEKRGFRPGTFPDNPEPGPLHSPGYRSSIANHRARC